MDLNAKYEAEVAVLGAIFLQPDLIHVTNLLPEHFTDPRNKQLYRVMHQLRSDGVAIDVITMYSRLTNPEAIVYMTNLAGSCPTAANYAYYEKIVLEEYEKQVVLLAAQQYIAQKDEQTFDKLVKVSREITSYHVEETTSQKDDMLDIYNSMFEDKGPLNGELSSGYPSIDYMTSGVKATDLIVIAGRPSMGKTAFAVNVALNIAKQAYKDKKNGEVEGLQQVDIFSIEMPRKALLQRIISNMGNIAGEYWRDTYRIPADIKNSIVQVQGVLGGLDLYIEDKSNVGVRDIERRIKEVQATGKVDKHVIVIDYLGLMDLDMKLRHDLAIAQITKGLKLLCKKYNVTIILLSQLSRGVETRQDKRPMLSDLRDSGSIEQDADVVMLLYRDDYYDREADEGLVEIIIAKNRNGAAGTVQLAFVKEYSKFVNLEIRLAEAN
ncbi:hypothetical protein BMT55_00050 [Listeria newyorkensis]|uniref:DNA 5'-3' helicase n=1 Tax=Listeria newyorkensis TaxID=1497681 RepID=A0ABX4XT75_9LIST|nr:replicative DNA helicase [Listeria newyorkensis]PNP94784.1 hypothetical protein BMT55_00050 [Listeria newyorkensis]